jgi:hypothetical protein
MAAELTGHAGAVAMGLISHFTIDNPHDVDLSCKNVFIFGHGCSSFHSDLTIVAVGTPLLILQPHHLRMAETSPPSSVTMSPVSQLLYRLGMTRDDLSKHSDQMRQFLVTDSSTFSTEHDTTRAPTETSTGGRTVSRSFSNFDASKSGRRDPPPSTPIKTESIETTLSGRKIDTMEAVIELQNASRRGRRRHESSDTPDSPTFRSPALLSASRHGSYSHSRVSRRDSLSRTRESVRRIPSEVYSAFLTIRSRSRIKLQPQVSSQDTLPPPLTPSGSRHYRDTVFDQNKFPARQV